MLALTLLAWPVAATFYRCRRRGISPSLEPLPPTHHLLYLISPCPLPKGTKGPLLLLFIAAALTIYLAPLGISSPCLMEYSQLPPKPGLVGHRGAPMVSVILHASPSSLPTYIQTQIYQLFYPAGP